MKQLKLQIIVIFAGSRCELVLSIDTVEHIITVRVRFWFNDGLSAVICKEIRKVVRFRQVGQRES